MEVSVFVRGRWVRIVFPFRTRRGAVCGLVDRGGKTEKHKVGKGRGRGSIWTSELKERKKRVSLPCYETMVFLFFRVVFCIEGRR